MLYKPEEIQNIKLLANNLRTDEEHLQRFFSQEKPITYSKISIPKRNKKLGNRIVYKIEEQFATDILKNLAGLLNELFIPLPCVHGFVSKRNTFSNAKEHLAKKQILHIDIKDFFETITMEQIKHSLIKIGFIEEISDHLSKITTLNGILIQGLNTSPILANIVCDDMDKELISLCNSMQATYTRYADDINISSNINLPILENISQIITKYGFTLNKAKTKYFFRGEKQYVTGLSVFDSFSPRIPRRMKKWIRLNLFYIGKYGIDSHICRMLKISKDELKTNPEKLLEISKQKAKLRKKIKGWIDYVNSVEKNLAIKYYNQYNNLFKN